MKGVSVEKLVNQFNFRVFTEGIDLKSVSIYSAEINRPGLELTGYLEHFATDRIQVIGHVEYTYLQTLDRARKVEVFEKLLSSGIPCFIFCRSYEPADYFLEIAQKYNVPVLGTETLTSNIISYMISYLSAELAKSISLHGVLVDVYGEGVLIMGESGIGKSEAALELIRRGHRLVSDDVVEVRRVNDSTLIGTSPGITRYFIELRGIGIIDVKTLFGVECVKQEQAIDLVIKLEEWKRDKEYDRLGLEDETIEILGKDVICHSIPIRPGRNLAVIVEAAAVNHRQKKMGYNAAQELYARVQENLTKGRDDTLG